MAAASISTNSSHPPVLDSRRKQTLIALLDALNELAKDGDFTAVTTDIWVADRMQEASSEDEYNSDVHEHLQKASVEMFRRFQRCLNNFDKELHNFASASRQVGSSAHIVASIFHLRRRLAVIGYLFHQNAAALFPRKIPPHTGLVFVPPVVSIPYRKERRKVPPHARWPDLPKPPDAEAFPEEIGALAEEVMVLLQSLNEFPEFTDKTLNTFIPAFDGDLRYWASYLKAYEGQFKYPAVQRYLHDLTTDMGDHLESITSSLSRIIEIGIPRSRSAQEHSTSNMVNLSTIATFFTAVTATTLQFSFDQTGTHLADSVNGFWFTSIVFSIAAAVNSLLGLTWRRALYRSPGYRVPWWVLIWIERLPLVFVVLSVACFSVGLVLFAYSSGQNDAVCVVVTVLTAFTNFGLIVFLAWFASERWIFSHWGGWILLPDAFDNICDCLLSTTTVAWTIQTIYRLRNSCKDVFRRARSLFQKFLSVPKRLSRPQQLHLPIAMSGEVTTTSVFPGQSSVATDVVHAPEAKMEASSSRPQTAASTSGVPPKANSTVGTTSDTFVPSPALAHFVDTVRSAMMMQSASSLLNHHREQSVPAAVGLDGQSDMAQTPVRSIRIAILASKFRKINPSEDILAHTALVRYLQFSPDGRFLATSSWDRTSVVLQVGEPFTMHRTLAHPSSFVSQVAWSPSGDLLLTKHTQSIKVWNKHGVCIRTIKRSRNVQSICWLPSGEAFFSVEVGSVAKLDPRGNELDQYQFDRLDIHNITVTPNGQRLLGAGVLLSSVDGLHPSKCRAEKQIISYNLKQKEIEYQVPVFHDIWDIALAKDGQFALVSYESKVLPQLWKLDIVKTQVGDRANCTPPTDATPQTSRLSLRHTFKTKFPIDFAGPCCFGGKDDQLVLCASKAGDIHIWDRGSGVLLRHIRSRAYGTGEITCIAWNPLLEPYTFATGYRDGMVRVWRVLPEAPSAPSTVDLEPKAELKDSQSTISLSPEPPHLGGTPTDDIVRQESGELSPMFVPSGDVAVNEPQSSDDNISSPINSTEPSVCIFDRAYSA